ncbi:MAG: LemA family protein [Candidatus Paceibacterota bacterium]|jgi:hypothetical protein
MVSTKQILLGILALVVLAVFAGAGILGWWSSTYNDLIYNEQLVQQKESGYGAQLDISTNKIEGLWAIYETYIDHESEVFKEATKERAQYYKAVNEGNATAQVQSALAFQVQALSIKEAFPQIVSAHLPEQTQREFSESINELDTALDDWIHQIQVYNVLRSSFFTSIVGNYYGFPKEYKYYKSEKTKLNVNEILNRKNQS